MDGGVGEEGMGWDGVLGDAEGRLVSILLLMQSYLGAAINSNRFPCAGPNGHIAQTPFAHLLVVHLECPQEYPLLVGNHAQRAVHQPLSYSPTPPDGNAI